MLLKWYQIFFVAHFWRSRFFATFDGDGAFGGPQRNNSKVLRSTTPPPTLGLFLLCADLFYSPLYRRVGLEGGKGEGGKGANCKPLCEFFSFLGVASIPLGILPNSSG